MLKNLLLSLTVLLFAGPAFSQHTVKGTITDTSTHADLKNAVISLLRSKDSVLIKFSRVGEGGKFQVKNTPEGKYVLLISHPRFADYADVIEVKEALDLGNISLLSKATILEDVIVRGSPIRMKGDTLAFIADSFKVREGATVEDLLKKLPGIQVNSKGEITAQGEKVTKVLVDGEEFFGDDPTLATQNMIAKAVKEVQVFDKKSDQATFTGVDDGQKTKTINLKLKDEFKKGYFGKVNLAGGIPDRWQNSAMINAFKDKRKFSVYGKMANTGETGLGWRDDSQYGGGLGMQTEITEDGGMMMWSSGDDFGGMGGFGGEGLPKSWMAGTSFSNKFNADKNSILGAYRYQKLNTAGTTTTSTQNLLPNNQFTNNETSQFQSNRWRNKGNLKSDIFIDSSQSLTITADGSYGGTNSYNLYESEAITNSKLPVNKNERSSISEGKNGTFNVNALYKKKFKKAGRTLSVNLSEKYNMNTSDGFLKSRLDLFKDGIYTGTDTTDQKKENDSRSLTLETRAAYTEPIGKHGILEFNYGYGMANSEQKRLSYDNINGKYESLNQLFSNDYKFATRTHRTGVGYRYNYKKIVLGFGSDVSFSNWKQTDLFTNTERNYDFNNFFPKANFSYKLGQYSRLRLNYSGRTQAPTINQLQPVLNNNDPLNIALGNPDLKQSFNNRFELGYNFYQVLKEQGLYSSFYYNPTSNDFSTKDQIDSSGRRLSQSVNVNGNYTFGGWMGYNFKLKKPGIRFGININPEIRRNQNFINGIANENLNRRFNIGFDAGKYKDKAYEISLGTEFSYNYTTSSIRPESKIEYWTITPTLNTKIDFPKDFVLSTDFNYNWRQKTGVFNTNNAFIWNASVNKKIMKKKDIRLGLMVNDLLNQNIGFRRDISTNFITEKTYDVIRRFWAATLTWNFNKGPQKEEQW
ncbi:MAG: outer membrane beta-barrel family protein [Bacteroidota bacterium]